MKLERLEIRLPPYEKAAIERQAVAAEMSVSAWVRKRLTADLTGDALAQSIANLIQQRQDSALQEIVEGLTEDRANFEAFRAGLRQALAQLSEHLVAEIRGAKK